MPSGTRSLNWERTNLPSGSQSFSAAFVLTALHTTQLRSEAVNSSNSSFARAVSSSSSAVGAGGGAGGGM